MLTNVNEIRSNPDIAPKGEVHGQGISRWATTELSRSQAVVNLPRALNPPSLFELWRASNLLTANWTSPKADMALP